MTKPKISIIVPVYNAERTLHRCVDSILAQSFTDFEVLLIDDGSKDQSLAICNEYADKDERIKVFHKDNGGVSSARNVGLANSSGKWISFIDSDDYVDSSFLETFYLYRDELETDVLLVQGISFDRSDYTERVLHKGLSCKCSSIEYVVNGDIGYSVNKLYSNKIIKDNSIHWDERFGCLEDELFVLDYMHCVESVQFIDCSFYHYLIPENFNKKYQISLLPVHLERFKKFKKMMDGSDISLNYLYGPLLSITLVDTIIRMGKGETFDKQVLTQLIDTVSGDVAHISGLKHFPLRVLAISSNEKYWLFIMKLFSLLF